MNVTRYAFPGGTIVEVNETDQVVVTTLPGGATVTAAPNTAPEDTARAHDLGYHGDTWAMSRDHELAHTYLATAIYGADWCPVMWAMAHGGPTGPWVGPWVDTVEAMVLDLQRRLAALPGRGRPWDALGPRS